MKKLIQILGCGLLMLGSVEATAATSDDQHLSLGVHVGAAFATLQGPSDVNTQNITGLAAGGILEVPFTESFYLQPEFSFVQRGANLSNNLSGAKINVRSDSLELPVFAKVKFGEVVKPYLMAGPNFIWNFNNKVTQQVAGVSLPFNPKDFDFALAFNAGVEFTNFFVEARYQLGLVALDGVSSEWRSRAIMLLAGAKL